MQLEGYDHALPQIREELTVTDQRADWTYRKFVKGKRWLEPRMGSAAFAERKAELAAARKQCLLFEDGQPWTYSGLRGFFQEQYGEETFKRVYTLPEPKIIPYANVPTKESRYYKVLAEDKLIAEAEWGPAGVEIGTGLGKSFIILKILKRLGLPAIVMSPSVNIAEQLYRDMVFHFGKNKVGFFGAGKKETGKLFTVGVAASLKNVKIGSPSWEKLSRALVFIADESHMCPADTLQSVCFGLAANAPYRFFFSGTQMRQDGLDLVLDGITGPIVYRKTVQEGVDEGFLARPCFRMCWVKSDARDRDQNLFASDDANEMTRAHAFYNPHLNEVAAEFANKAVAVMERPTVIMIDEYKQLKHILPYLRYDVQFAHGAITDENKEHVPEKFWDSDPLQLVDDFNRGKFPILIGTSAIRVGTDITAVKLLVNLCQGKSEIDVRQTVGRTTRLVPGKEDCIVVDFGVKNIEILEKHAKERLRLYKEICNDDVVELEL